MKCQDCSHRQFSELSDQVVYRHLAWQHVFGIFPLLRYTTCFLRYFQQVELRNLQHVRS
ncbi:TOTE conflict system archaeo-eukaryotic primase domain-containing protein [Teredinibacter turnerae]|uniref:TOTE conflict system archaeo-eukaryotic primase domain-containing protein n=1 Tax=Teredinibacter turnerae TaxID=2426 RepID=UPI0039F1B918